MEYTVWGDPIETFESLTLPLKNFVGCATNLPNSANEWVDLDTYYKSNIKSKIGEFLTIKKCYDQLEYWADSLKKITNVTIEKSFPTEIDWFVSQTNQENVKKQIKNVVDFITNILQTHKKLTPKSKYYFIYLGKPFKLNQLKEALANNRMIDKETPYFTEILQGDPKAKNKYIDWKTCPSQ